MARLKDLKEESKKKLTEANKESAFASKLAKRPPHLLKFLKLQQHQDDLLQWMTGSSNESLQFVR